MEIFSTITSDCFAKKWPVNLPVSTGNLGPGEKSS